MKHFPARCRGCPTSSPTSTPPACRLFAITNYGAEFWAKWRPTIPLFDRFAGIVVSGEEGMMKPAPEIYALALDRFGLGPGDGAFIDDRADNVAAADQAGLIGHVFVDAADTRAWLTGLHLL